MSLIKKFPFTLQLYAMDCGPACLRMVAKYYGRNYSLQTLRQKSFITREGVSMLGISDAAESIGFRTNGVKIDFNQLCNGSGKVKPKLRLDLGSFRTNLL